MDPNRLFRDEWLIGNLDILGVVADIIGTICIFFISLTGFGIVMSSIFNNALHGLYAVSPKFWDRVDEAKRAQFDAKGGGNQVSKALGTITSVLLSCCPNVKAMTNFDDEILDAKAYFFRAIPLMCLSVFIGVLIFFGYPTKFVKAVSIFGTGVIDLALANIDPLSWVQALPGEFVLLDLATDGSELSHDKVINDVTRSCFKSYTGLCNDVKKERRNALAREIEMWVMGEMTAYQQYTNDDAYDYKLSTYVVTGEPDLTSRDNQSVGNIYSIAKKIPASTWNVDGLTAVNTDNQWLVFTINFTKKASTGKTVTTSVENSATVPSSNIQTNSQNGTVTVTFGESSSEYYLRTTGNISASIYLEGESSPITVTAKQVEGGNKITFTADTASGANKLKEAGANIANISSISGLYYNGGGSHPITSITYGESVSFKSGDANIGSWNWGSAPKALTADEQGAGSSSNIVDPNASMPTISPNIGGLGDSGQSSPTDNTNTGVVNPVE